MSPPPPPPRTLLVVRDDRLGDFMLAWPAFALLRKGLPHTRIVVLVPEYTSGIARLCPSVDDLLVVPHPVRDKGASDALAKRLEEGRPDAVVSFFSHYYTARAFRRARVPVRIAPAVKLARIFHTHRLPQHRSQSLQPEYRYNLDLAAYALALWGGRPPEVPAPPYLVFPPERTRERRREIHTRHRIHERAHLIAVHPGHRGSAHNLSVEGYGQLGRAIVDAIPSSFLLVTSGPDREDRQRARSLCERLEEGGIPNSFHESLQGLDSFALDLSAVNAFVSGSTGPLHLAACLGIPTVGFFPEKRSANATRWNPPGKPGDHLAVTRPLDRGRDALDPPGPEDHAAIREFLARHFGPVKE